MVPVSKGVNPLLRQETIISDQKLNSTSCTMNAIYLFQEYTPNFKTQLCYINSATGSGEWMDGWTEGRKEEWTTTYFETSRI